MEVDTEAEAIGGGEADVVIVGCCRIGAAGVEEGLHLGGGDGVAGYLLEAGIAAEDGGAVFGEEEVAGIDRASELEECGEGMVHGFVGGVDEFNTNRRRVSCEKWLNRGRRWRGWRELK